MSRTLSRYALPLAILAACAACAAPGDTAGAADALDTGAPAAPPTAPALLCEDVEGDLTYDGAPTAGRLLAVAYRCDAAPDADRSCEPVGYSAIGAAAYPLGGGPWYRLCWL